MALMRADVRELIGSSAYCQASLREIAALLPPDDAELDGWLAEAVRSADQLHFFYTVSAALLVERKVQARHLARGAMLLPGIGYLTGLSWHMDGEVGQHLVEAAHNGGLNNILHAEALFAAAAWCKEHGAAFPPELISAARAQARRKEQRSEETAFLHSVAGMTEDAGLIDVLGRAAVERMQAATVRYATGFIAMARKPLREWVIATPPREHISLHPLRRAVARIGRNEPCPCGSGKKYKNCCAAKDQQRLALSTDVAGRTMAELQAEPEQYMTATRLDRSQPYDLKRIDPTKLAPELLQNYLFRLAAFSLYEEYAAAFEKLGVPEALEDAWKRLFFFLIRGERPDIIKRVLDVHPRGYELLPGLDPGVRLAVGHDHGDTYLQVLEEEALAALKNEDPMLLCKFAGALLHSRIPAIGMFVARSMLQILPKKDAYYVFNEMLLTRDRLGLSPADCYSEIIDARFAESTPEDSDELRASRKQLAQKSAEARQLAEKLNAVERDLKRREQAAEKRERETATALTAAQQQEMRDLREKATRYKSALKAEHDELSVARKTVFKLQCELDAKPAPPPAKTDTAAADAEEELNEAAHLPGTQPVRLIEFPKKFAATLSRYPSRVSRAAMCLIGELAAGEENAFAGVVRLKACHDVLRQRVAGDYRLLFRLEPQSLCVVDLVNRKDLFARIKLLRANGLPAAEVRLRG